jgi:prepilin-type N-terminal cleavage/methylation domain-containing protein
MNPKSTKGFTLMELIIVLAILAIIAAILIPMFLNTTDRARLRSDIQSARVIQNAVDLYRVERGRDVEGGNNMSTVLQNLETAGYIALRDTRIQTEGAAWTIDGDRRVHVNISGSPQSVRDIYPSLSEAERLMVRTTN